MKFWVELHCEFNFDGPDETGTINFCQTHNNHNVNGMFGTLKKVRTRLEVIAARREWQKFGNKWACKNCKTKVEVSKDQSNSE